MRTIAPLVPLFVAFVVKKPLTVLCVLCVE